MTLSLIVAMARNRVIGRDGRLPWHLRPDLERFKRLTMGHPLLVGRRTFESIGRPLPGRHLVVVSRRPGYAPAGVQVAGSLEQALALARKLPGADEVFVGGGESLYRDALASADRLYLTFIDRDFDGDVRFPEFHEADWRLVSSERHEPPPAAAGGGAGDPSFAFEFRVHERVRPEAAGT